jgi:uncharacterized integral membrane protein (TIGR00698 family)
MSRVETTAASVLPSSETLRRLAPGVLLSAAVAALAVLAEAPLGLLLKGLTGRPFVVPAMVLALVAGVSLNRVAARPGFAPGLTFCVKRLLRVAVALLGIRVAVSDIVALGPATALVVVGAMALTIASGVGLARLFGRSDAYGALAGGATAVCGASAALATSTVLPDYKGKDADTAFVVVAVNALATVAMVLYPPLCAALGFDDRLTGIMLGATIHDVAQVVGAGYAVSDIAGNTAVVVKLFRVFLLLPAVLAVGWWFAAQGGHAERARVPVPVFALVFLALVLVNSLGLVPLALKAAMVEASRWGLLLAIAALGLGTSPRAIARLGWRHIVVVTGVTLVILAAATLGLWALG